jgi:CBS domain-containing protein
MKLVREMIAGQTLISVRSDTSVRNAVQLMTDRNIGALPVLEGSALIGIFTERDVMSRVVARNLSPANTNVSQVMTREVAAAAPEDTMIACIERMQSSGYRHLPVVENDAVIGMISLRDLLDYQRDAVEREKNILSDLVRDDPIYDV